MKVRHGEEVSADSERSVLRNATAVVDTRVPVQLEVITDH